MFFFPENNRVARMDNGAFLHSISFVQALGVARTLKIIIPAVDEITARRSIGHVIRWRQADSYRVGQNGDIGGTKQNFYVFSVIVVKMVRPAIGFTTWRTGALVVVHVHSRGEVELPEIVDASDAFAGFLRAGQDRQQHRLRQ